MCWRFYVEIESPSQSMPNTEQCRSMLDQSWSYSRHWSQCRSIPINADQCKINAAWSGIDLHWPALIGIERNWSTSIGIERNLGSMPWLWSALGIDPWRLVRYSIYMTCNFQQVKWDDLVLEHNFWVQFTSTVLFCASVKEYRHIQDRIQ